ncbi:MAG: O-antigen ligase family protein [Nostocaceae cyanobacterium]|nr:O-antigen ligase family protein [Nostocaceae cyanobacterium]
MTIKEGISLILTTLFGLYFATRYTLREQIKLLSWMFIIVIILSIIFAVVPPRYGLMGGVHAGVFRGIYTHKNNFGKMITLGAIIFLIRAIDAKKYNLIFWFLFLISIILLAAARSTTALGVFVIMLLLFFIYRTFRWRYEVMVPTTFAIATFGGGLLMWIVDQAESLASSIGKDTTLTGRTDFWPFLWEMIEKRPMLGYGFSAFWESNDAFYIWRAANWKVTDPHNGFLDLALGLGALGVAVFFIGFFLNVLKAINLVHLSKTTEGLWPLLYLTNIIIANLTETSLLAGGLYWVLYVTVSFSLLIPSEQGTKTFK